MIVNPQKMTRINPKVLTARALLLFELPDPHQDLWLQTVCLFRTFGSTESLAVSLPGDSGIFTVSRRPRCPWEFLRPSASKYLPTSERYKTLLNQAMLTRKRADPRVPPLSRASPRATAYDMEGNLSPRSTNSVYWSNYA